MLNGWPPYVLDGFSLFYQSAVGPVLGGDVVVGVH